MSAGWKTSGTQQNSFTIDYWKKTQPTVKDNTSRIQPWGRNKSFIGLL